MPSLHTFVKRSKGLCLRYGSQTILASTSSLYAYIDNAVYHRCSSFCNNS